MKGQLALHVPNPITRRYWEHAGPRQWRAVVVRVRYGGTKALPAPVFPLVVTKPTAPRNVLVERADGTMDVRPVRLLWLRCPGQRVA